MPSWDWVARGSETSKRRYEVVQAPFGAVAQQETRTCLHKLALLPQETSIRRVCAFLGFDKLPVIFALNSDIDLTDTGNPRVTSEGWCTSAELLANTPPKSEGASAWKAQDSKSSQSEGTECA